MPLAIAGTPPPFVQGATLTWQWALGLAVLLVAGIALAAATLAHSRAPSNGSGQRPNKH